MAHFIIKQPDGKLALWSTIVDDFIRVDASREELIAYWLEDYRLELEKRIDKAEQIGGEHMTWEECMQEIEEKVKFNASEE